jgi:hypothetical protein
LTSISIAPPSFQSDWAIDAGLDGSLATDLRREFLGLLDRRGAHSACDGPLRNLDAVARLERV